MRIQIEGSTPNETVVNFSLVQDEDDVDIRANGETIAYFHIKNEQIVLELVRGVETEENFSLEPSEEGLGDVIKVLR